MRRSQESKPPSKQWSICLWCVEFQQQKSSCLDLEGFLGNPQTKLTWTHTHTHTHTHTSLLERFISDKKHNWICFLLPSYFLEQSFFCWNPLGSCLFSNKNPIRWFLRSIAHKPSKPSALLKIHGHPSRIHQPVRRGCFFVNKNHAISTVRNVEEHVGGLKIPMVIQRAWCI